MVIEKLRQEFPRNIIQLYHKTIQNNQIKMYL